MPYPVGGFKTSQLDHLGLVAAMFDQLKIGETLDAAIDQNMEKRNLSIGTIVKAMVLNGLGFVNQTLYLTPDFFRTIALERLLGPSVTAQMLDDNALGRCLDKLFKNNLELLFCKTSMVALKELEILRSLQIHLDSSSFHVHGQYEQEPEMGTIKITHGFSKDHRPDLKQAVLNLITENKAGIPVLMSPADGNSEDKKGFREIINNQIKQLQQSELSYIIADSALYNAQTLKDLDAHGMKWVSRVPETSLDALWVLDHADISIMTDLKAGYRYNVVGNQYAGIQQRWMLIHSESKQAREEKTLLKKLIKLTQSEFKQLEKLKKKAFFCQTDAKEAFVRFCSQLKYGQVEAFEIIEKNVYKKSGRPTQDSEVSRIEFYISGCISFNLSTYQEQATRTGFFIIATNQCDEEELSNLECFELYKDQNNTVERGFRFMKDPMFMLDNLFLKLPQRIMALMMIMSLCLMVYAAVEYKIRLELAANDVKFPNQKGKMVDNPTARWVFFYFRGVTVLTLPDGSSQITNMNQHHTMVIGLLGAAFEYYYT